MTMPDEFSAYYQEELDGTYDCVDRIVLNAYFYFAQSGGGFRLWWRSLHGDDEHLDDTHLMRYAGRFSRRIHRYAESNGIPLIHCKRGERKHELAERLLPSDPEFRGLFCILAGLAPAPLREVKACRNGQPHLQTKKPYSWVNHYSFHILDPDWGHIIIKLCPHPPFNAQIILNGHEYVERQARKQGLAFGKEGNCFTQISDARALAGVADAMTAPGGGGRLARVCERWIYSSCLVFALNLEEQKRSGFRYGYSVYQGEYSRNLLFTRGRTMDQVFNGVIDRTRGPLDIKTLKTIFGYKSRPYKRDLRGKRPRLEVAVERPVYDLTIFKIHFGKLTVKIYSKGERVLRIEVIVHNTTDLRCKRGVEYFPRMMSELKAILDRFLSVLRGVHAAFLNDEALDELPRPSRQGQKRVAGIDVNNPRMRVVIEAVIALAVQPGGFTVSELQAKVCALRGWSETQYSKRQAAYDLSKLRAKGPIKKVPRSRRHQHDPQGLQILCGLLILREKVIRPVLSSLGRAQPGKRPKQCGAIDIHYENLQQELHHAFQTLGIAA